MLWIIDADNNVLSFDIVYSFKLSHPISLREQVLPWLTKEYQGYDINIGLVRNYSE